MILRKGQGPGATEATDHAGLAIKPGKQNLLSERLRACSHRQFFCQVRVDVLHYIPMIQSVFVKKIFKTLLPAGFFHCSGWFSSWEKFNLPRKSTRHQAVFGQLTNERELTSLCQQKKNDDPNQKVFADEATGGPCK